MITLLRTFAASALIGATLLGAPSVAGAAEADTTYRYQAIDYPGAANTALYAINVRGHYVGAMKDAVTGAHHAVHGQGGSIKLLDPDGLVGQARESWAFTTNGLGQVGGVYLDDAGVRHGFILHPGGAVQTIDMPGAFGTQVYGLNDRGQFIGLYRDAAGLDHAYVNRNGSFVNADLPGGLQTIPLSITDSGQIVGEFVKTEGTTGYGYIQYPDGRFTLHTAPDSPPEQTFYISMNNRRQILGAWFDADGLAHNFIRRHGRYTPFDLPESLGAIYVQAETINDQGDVVGYWFDSNGVAHAFLANHPVGP
jgi:uncharacterized membrane protein